MKEELTLENKIFLSIPFPSAETALLAHDVLKVDKEFKGSGISRKIATDGVNLLINFYGCDLKRLRVTLNANLKNIILIVKTMNQFQRD